MNIQLRSVLFAVLVIQLVSSSSCKKENNESKSDIIESLMISTQAQLKSPGWMAAMYSPDETIVLTGGLASIEENIAMKRDQQLRIGSVTKTFVATLVLILVDEGKLSLNEKLSNYYPHFPKSDEITIRHLLMHTSGIVTWDENEDIRNSIYDGTGNWTIDKLIDWASEQTLLSDPGMQFHYSNIGYFLLGKIIEHVTETSVAEALRDKITVPLGLKNTFMAEVPHPVSEVIHGYDESSGAIEDITNFPPSDEINFHLAWTAGGLFSSLDDMSNWARALAIGSLLSDSLHQQQMPVLNPPSASLPYWKGYGMGVNQTDVWIGHTGAVSGFICNMNHYPEKNVTVISFFNKFSAFSLEHNTSDLNLVSNNYLELLLIACPETLQPEN